MEGSSDEMNRSAPNQPSNLTPPLDSPETEVDRTGYDVTLVSGAVEFVPGADAYAQEGPLTTFFDTAGRDVVDSWAVRLLSVRTVDIAIVRRLGVRSSDVSLPMVVGGQFSRTFDSSMDNALAS